MPRGGSRYTLIAALAALAAAFACTPTALAGGGEPTHAVTPLSAPASAHISAALSLAAFQHRANAQCGKSQDEAAAAVSRIPVSGPNDWAATAKALRIIEPLLAHLIHQLAALTPPTPYQARWHRLLGLLSVFVAKLPALRADAQAHSRTKIEKLVRSLEPQGSEADTILKDLNLGTCLGVTSAATEEGASLGAGEGLPAATSEGAPAAAPPSEGSPGLLGE